MGPSVAFLTLVVQGREVRRFELSATTTSIGRSQENDIVINNLALSRRHAEVLLRRGRYEVQDLGSQNGVYVNNSRIRSPQPLNHSDTITLGTYHFVFNADEEVSEESPTTSRRERPSPRADVDAASEEPVALLVVKYNDVELQRLPVRDVESLIGRARECDIQIAERRLSRRHCKVYREGDRHYVTDLGSQNGTYVNRRRIPDRYELHDGDVLNFAEYSVLFLEDATTYDGPDRAAESLALHVRPGSSLEKEKTSAPQAYQGGKPLVTRPKLLDPSQPVDRAAVHRADVDSKVRPFPGRTLGAATPPEPAEPIVERPKNARARRKDVHSTRRPDKRATVAPPVFRDRGRDRLVAHRSRDGSELRPTSRRVQEQPRGQDRVEGQHRDVEDRSREVRPESALDEWYNQREDSGVEEEPSVFLERSKSSMSQILSTMMVDKRDLERHLRSRARERGFAVRVEAQGRVMYDGPLASPVTILGTDDEADIRLVGRYVAGRHSLLVQVRDSLLLVRLGSSSAARVNGLPKLQAFLRPGDTIQIDETTIEIRER